MILAWMTEERNTRLFRGGDLCDLSTYPLLDFSGSPGEKHSRYWPAAFYPEVGLGRRTIILTMVL